MVLSFRLKQCLGTFTMLPMKECSETALFRHISKHVFRGPYFRKYMSYKGHLFFWKFLKFNVDFENKKKHAQKIICFWDNCIWIGCVKLSLLRRQYLTLSVNLLTNSYKVLHIIKRDFFRLKSVQNDH